ncbi:uncharacterized protein [Nicotiana tomentosiformis]|uniref:uncharacterized protein n=1 Tax=Nicotiana tomentosiformis TaxID=4098 RepID=UPI00388CD17F
MAVLGNYEKISAQMINKDKSSYYMYSNVANGLFQAVGAIKGFARGKLLSFGGKATLISSVLQSTPIHMLSVLDPSNNILGHLHKTFARFFWSTKEEGKSRHWASWQNLFLSKEEGALGFRSLNDVSRELFAKLWWRFRTTKSLWSNFMWNNYCKKEPPTVVHFRGGSHVWRQMLNAREEVEHEIIIRHWWYAQCCPKLKPLFQAIPAIINWEQWKRRNVGKHGGSMSTNRVIHDINRTLHQLARVRYSWIPNIPLLWPYIIQYFEGYKPILITTRVTSQLPCHGWYKCNTDGASKGNPGPSSLGFCMRDDEGDVVYARVVDLGVKTNVVDEAKAILQGLEYCVEHDFQPLILETNSLVMKKAIEGE